MSERMSRHVVLLTDRFALDAAARLRADAKLDVRVSAAPEPTDAELHDAEVLVIRSRTKISASLLASAPRLRLIVTATSGFDHIDFSATTARGIPVTYTPEANAQSAAELTWALVLACARRLPEAVRAVKTGDWARESLIGHELSGKTYGVIGLGRIGTRVSAFARAFGMRVLAFDPYRDEEYFGRFEAQRVGLNELVRLADVLSVHVPATPETKGLLHAGHFAISNPGLIVVNTSRGQAIDEVALITALEGGHLRAVGLDVYEKEPLNRASPLLNFANVVLTPHLGATTHEAFAKASHEAAHKVVRFFAAGEIDDRLPPADPWFGSPRKTRDGD